MEMLSWMKKVDTRMKKSSLLQLIDEMHGVIHALLVDNKRYKDTILELKKALEQQQ
ncbi:hypothetical protein [Natronincola ferrireducens]|uniref:Uncharacterized protein n=1 Tax=Natronincola ferrireducens TaxID=393762 RepID=A0A1G8XUP8_9FIRM|nr:hypothetical protein [Natronincola ferrireducens]SDJ93894.1 hypothetical protein SAMN05660472_00325 [Natronincola ferrireducens]